MSHSPSRVSSSPSSSHPPVPLPLPPSAASVRLLVMRRRVRAPSPPVAPCRPVLLARKAPRGQEEQAHGQAEGALPLALLANANNNAPPAPTATHALLGSPSVYASQLLLHGYPCVAPPLQPVRPSSPVAETLEHKQSIDAESRVKAKLQRHLTAGRTQSASQQQRVMQRWQHTQSLWQRYCGELSAKLQQPVDKLNISRSSAYRAQLEQRASRAVERNLSINLTPAAWVTTLRNASADGCTVAVGNMFSGLFCHVKADDEKRQEIVRRPDQGWQDCVVRGRDLFDDDGDAEAQIANGDEMEFDDSETPSDEQQQQQQQLAVEKKHKPSKRVTHPTFEEPLPVEGPSLLLSTSQLSFSCTTGSGAQLLSECSASSSQHHDRCVHAASDTHSRHVSLHNNGSTVLHWEWRTQANMLERNGVLSAASPPHVPFTCVQPSGTLLPGATTTVTFTYTCSQPGAYTQPMHLYTLPHVNKPMHDAQRLDGGAPCLLLRGLTSRIDSGAVSRAAFDAELYESMTSRIVQLALHQRAAMVREPSPDKSLHRQIFYNKNRDLKLFYYEERMSEWRQLAADVFSCHKRADRARLRWDYSASQLKSLIDRIPPRNRHLVAELSDRWSSLVGVCSIRPAPHPVRYNVLFSLLSSVAAGVARNSHAIRMELNISEPLEQVVRKQREEAKRKEDEEAKAKLPFHMRNPQVNLHALTPEQRKAREEEQQKVAEAKAKQDAEDAEKLNERNELEKSYSERLHSLIKQQLTDSFQYFDVLSSPPCTDAAPAAYVSSNSLSEKDSVSLPIDAHYPPESAATPVESRPTSSPGLTLKKKAQLDKDGKTPPHSRPITPRVEVAKHRKEQSIHEETNVVEPPPLSSADFSLLKSHALSSLLLLERTRVSSQRLRYALGLWGNTYNTLDTGVHVDTPEQIKAKEERERMQRYGYVVGKAEREAEERKIRDAHPLAILAKREILLASSSSIFSLAFTRERGFYAWVALDPPDVEELDKKGKPVKAQNKTKLQEMRKHILSAAGGAITSPAKGKADKEKDALDSARSSGKPASSSTKNTPRALPSPKAAAPGPAVKKPATKTPRPDSRERAQETSVKEAPTIPTGSLPLGQICPSPSGVPVPTFIPELTGFDVVSVSCGVYHAAMITTLGQLVLWEHQTRKVTVLGGELPWPGWKRIQQQLKREETASALAASGAQAAQSRPVSREDLQPAKKDEAHNARKKEKEEKVASKSRSKKKKDEEEVSVDDHSATLARDSSLDGKYLVEVAIGGGSRLSACIATPVNPELEWIVVRSKDGCVYTSFIGKSRDEKNTAVLGVGDKKAAPPQHDPSAPLVQFELVTALHPLNLPRTGNSTTAQVVSLSVGYSHALALLNDGSVYAWGDAQVWGDKKPRSTPTIVHYKAKQEGKEKGEKASEKKEEHVHELQADDPCTAIAAGGFHSLFLFSSGLYGSGRNSEGQLGVGDTRDREALTLIPTLSHRSAQPVPPTPHSAAPSGRSTKEKPSKDKEHTDKPAVEGPTHLADDFHIVSLAAGGAHSVIVAVPLSASANPQVWCFGRGGSGALGRGDNEDALWPVNIQLREHVQEAAAAGDCCTVKILRKKEEKFGEEEEEEEQNAVLIN